MRFATFVLTLPRFPYTQRILHLNHSSVSSKRRFIYCKMIITYHPFYVFFQLCFLLAYPHPLLRLVSSFNLDFILALDFGCTVSWHLPSSHKRSSRDISLLLTYDTTVFSLLILRYRTFSINQVIDSFTRIAALLDLQNIIEPSA